MTLKSLQLLGDRDPLDPLLNHSSRVIPEWVLGRPPYDVEVSPHVVTFGMQVVPLMSETQTLTVTNTGFEILPFENITVDRPFYLGSQPPAKLLPGESFDLLIRFKPEVYGLGDGYLTIEFGPKLGKKVIRLLGQGIWDYREAALNMTEGLWQFLKRSVQPAVKTEGPDLTLNTKIVWFPLAQTVGTESDISVLSVTNIGTEPLIISDPVITGEFEVVP